MSGPDGGSGGSPRSPVAWSRGFGPQHFSPLWKGRKGDLHPAALGLHPPRDPRAEPCAPVWPPHHAPGGAGTQQELTKASELADARAGEPSADAATRSHGGDGPQPSGRPATSHQPLKIKAPGHQAEGGTTQASTSGLAGQLRALRALSGRRGLLQGEAGHAPQRGGPEDTRVAPHT